MYVSEAMCIMLFNAQNQLKSTQFKVTFQVCLNFWWIRTDIAQCYDVNNLKLSISKHIYFIFHFLIIRTDVSLILEKVSWKHNQSSKCKTVNTWQIPSTLPKQRVWYFILIMCFFLNLFMLQDIWCMFKWLQSTSLVRRSIRTLGTELSNSQQRLSGTQQSVPVYNET